MNNSGELQDKISYVEFPTRSIKTVKTFFNTVFGWEFIDYGADYSAFYNAGLHGGFYLSEKQNCAEDGGALIVLYSTHLEDTRLKIENAGGLINKPIFSFPGGRRFHFLDPTGNEYAVWSDKL